MITKSKLLLCGCIVEDDWHTSDLLSRSLARPYWLGNIQTTLGKPPSPPKGWSRGWWEGSSEFLRGAPQESSRSTAGHIVEDVFREWDQSVCQAQIIRHQAPETERGEPANLPLEKEPSMYRQKGEAEGGLAKHVPAQGGGHEGPPEPEVKPSVSHATDLQRAEGSPWGSQTLSSPLRSVTSAASGTA
ncbi:unnamed protein product [Boreogadus saida]